MLAHQNLFPGRGGPDRSDRGKGCGGRGGEGVTALNDPDAEGREVPAIPSAGRPDRQGMLAAYRWPRFPCWAPQRWPEKAGHRGAASSGEEHHVRSDGVPCLRGISLLPFPRLRSAEAPVAPHSSRGRLRGNLFGPPVGKFRAPVSSDKRHHQSRQRAAQRQAQSRHQHADFEIARHRVFPGVPSDRTLMKRRLARSPHWASPGAELASRGQTPDIALGRLAMDEPLANRVRSGRKQP